MTYQGIACLSVLLDKPLTNNYITYLMSALPFTAVIDMSALVGAKQLQDHGLVYLPRYVRSDDPLLSRDEDSIVEEFLGSLPRVYPEFSREDVVAVRLSRAKYVLPVPTIRVLLEAPADANVRPWAVPRQLRADHRWDLERQRDARCRRASPARAAGGMSSAQRGDR